MLRRGDTGDWIGTFDGHGIACVWSCALNKPALLAATASADFSCKLWNAITGDEQHSWEHPHIVRSVDFGACTDKLATGCRDKAVRVYDVNVPNAPPQCMPDAPDSIRTVKWLNNDHSLLVSYVNSPGMGLYDARTGKLARTLESPDVVTSIDVTYDGRHFTAACGKAIRVYRAGDQGVQAAITTEHRTESASVCMEKGLVVAGGEDMWAHVLDLHSGKPLTVHKGHHGPVWSIQFAHDGESFASASEDGTIRIWYTQSSYD